MRILSILALSLLMFAIGHAQSSQKRLGDFLKAFNSKDDATIRTMMDANFDPSIYARRKPEEWSAQLKQFATDLAPLAIREILLDKETAIVAAVLTASGEKMGLRLDLAKEAPHRIVGLRFSGNVQGLVEERKKVEIRDYKDLSDLARQVRNGYKVPAIAIAVFQGGKLETAVDGLREVGKSDPVTVNDRWLVGSIGKSMTSTLIGRLIDEGKLDWNSKLGDLLKDVPMLPEYRDVKLEQIMQHRGGMPQDLNFEGQTVDRIVGRLADPTAIRAAYVKDILSRKPIAKPGEKFAYSNAGYAILGHIAERVTGKPFEILLKEYVFNPIGMDSAIAGLPGTDGQPSGRGEPHGHIPTADGYEPHVLDGPLNYMGAPAGLGVSCSIGDLAKYVAWHMRGYLGEPIELKTETVRRLHTQMADKGQYAAGWVIGDGFQGHNGSDGTFVAEIAFWPKERFAAAAIVNCGGAENPSPPMQAILAVYKKLFGK